MRQTQTRSQLPTGMTGGKYAIFPIWDRIFRTTDGPDKHCCVRARACRQVRSFRSLLRRVTRCSRRQTRSLTAAHMREQSARAGTGQYIGKVCVRRAMGWVKGVAALPTLRKDVSHSAKPWSRLKDWSTAPRRILLLLLERHGTHRGEG